MNSICQKKKKNKIGTRLSENLFFKPQQINPDHRVTQNLLKLCRVYIEREKNKLLFVV